MKMLALAEQPVLTSKATAAPIEFDLPDDISVEHLDGDNWDRFAINFRDVIHEQTHCFNAARNKADDLIRLAVHRNDQPIGGALAKIFKIPGVRTKVAIIRWGPLWKPFAAHTSINNLKSVYQAVTRWLSHEHNCFVLIIPKADPEYSLSETSILSQLGFQPSYQPASPERYFVNVDQSCDEIKSSFAQKWRYNLRKSEKSNLDIRFLEPFEGLPLFMQLYQSMVDRKKFLETSPIETLNRLLASETKSLRPKIVIASKQNEPVAGAVIDCSGEQAIYLYGATNDKALQLRAGYAIHWEIIQHLAAIEHIRWYDLGGGTGKQCALHQFKRGMVGKTGTVAMVPNYYYYGSNLIQNLVGKSLLNLELAKSGIQKTIHEKRTAFLGK